MVKIKRPKIFNYIENHIQKAHLDAISLSNVINDHGKEIKRFCLISNPIFIQIIHKIILAQSKEDKLNLVEKFCKLKNYKWKKEIELVNLP